MTNFKADINGEEVFFQIAKSEAFFYTNCEENMLVKDKNGTQKIVGKDDLKNISVLNHNFDDTTIYIK